MHRLLSFFHVAVHHADVTVNDANVLGRRVGILLGSFSNFDALNKQAQEFESPHLHQTAKFDFKILRKKSRYVLTPLFTFDNTGVIMLYA